MNLSKDTFLWALGSLCNIHRLPFEARLLLSQFTPPYNTKSLVDAGDKLGIELKEQRIDERTPLEKLPTPFIAIKKGTLVVPQLSDGEAGAETTTELALVVRADQEKILLFMSGATTPTTQTAKEFARDFETFTLLAFTKSQPVNDEDSPNDSLEFGLKWFLPEITRHKTIWRDVLLASLAIQLVALVTPLFTQAIIDKVIVNQTMNTLMVIGFALIVFLLFTAVMSWIRQYLVIHTGNRIDAALGTAVFEKLFRLPHRYFEHRPTGVIAARLHAVETIREFVTGAAVTLILDLPFLVIFLAIMFYYSVSLTFIAIGILAIIAVLSALIAPVFQARLNEQFLLGARNQAFVTEYISGMETVKSLQMEPQLITKYSDYLKTYLDASFKTKQLGNTYNTIANTLEQIMTTGILLMGAYTVMTNPAFSIGMLVAFQMFAGRVSQPILRIVGLWQQFQQAQIAILRLADIMNAPSEPYSVVPQGQFGGAGKIEFKEVSFRYREELPYLYQGLNLTILPGQCVAIMGPSGCGKSTLAKLLQGFYLPTSGMIAVDSKDVRNLSANELRNYFGVVPQDTTLFAGTLYDNLILANPHANFEMVVSACKFAEIHDVIERLPEGYQTQIGERGVGLSGGQKQRLAIARALIKRPRVLVFDESTSNLDAETAAQFAKTVSTLQGKITLMFITHQLPATLKFDQLIRLDTIAHASRPE